MGIKFKNKDGKILNAINYIASDSQVEKSIQAKIDNGEINVIAGNKATELYNRVDGLSNRVDVAVSTLTDTDNSTYATELADIRTANDGTLYQSAGKAVREQVNSLKTDIEDICSEIDNIVEVQYSFNRYDKNSLVPGSMNNGSILNDPNYMSTDYITVTSQNFYFRSFTASMSAKAVNEFDKDKNFIKASQYIGSMTLDPKTKFIRVSVSSSRIDEDIVINFGTPSTKYTPYYKYYKLKDEVALSQDIMASPFYGKYVTWYGDSIIQNTWWDPISKLYGMISTNCGVGGARISGSDLSCMWRLERIEGNYNNVTDPNTGLVTKKGISIPTKTDYIFIGGGTNDWAQSVALGNKTEYNSDGSPLYDTTKFYGACHQMFKNLIAQRPNAKIVVLGTPFAIYSNRFGNNTYGISNGQGLTALDYENALCEVAEMWGIPTFRYGHKMGINDSNARDLLNPEEPNGHLHPNTDNARKRFVNATLNEMNKIKYMY